MVQVLLNIKQILSKKIQQNKKINIKKNWNKLLGIVGKALTSGFHGGDFVGF